MIAIPYYAPLPVCGTIRKFHPCQTKEPARSVVTVLLSVWGLVLPDNPEALSSRKSNERSLYIPQLQSAANHDLSVKKPASLDYPC